MLYFNKKTPTINEFHFFKKKVLIRVDFNVSMNRDNSISNDYRIKLSLKTIKKILQDGGLVVLMSHLGRPQGKFTKHLSLRNIIPILSKLLNKKILFISNYIGKSLKDFKFKYGDVVLLENLRFHQEEEKCDDQFAQALSRFGDFYINDAFATSHRKHASTYGIYKFFKKKCLGYLMIKEIKFLTNFIENKNKPITAILGGAKIESKLDMIENILKFVDFVLLGGVMSNTFIKSDNGSIGSSLFNEKFLTRSKKILHKNINKIILPIDVIASNSLSDDNELIFNSYSIPFGWKSFDIGPKTINIFLKKIEISKTILWNGPMGVFEFFKYSIGTFSIANKLAHVTKHHNSFSLIGGGDSVSSIQKLGLDNKNYSYISTGGGAMLSFLSGKKLSSIYCI